METLKAPAFFSYAREDSAVALHLASDLKQAGASVWLDQLDIRPGRQWDREVEQALNTCREMIVVLSPASVASNNVMDEVAYALEQGKTVIPLLVQDCLIPFRLRRVQYVDFRSDYSGGLKSLLSTLAAEDHLQTEDLPADRARRVDVNNGNAEATLRTHKLARRRLNEVKRHPVLAIVSAVVLTGIFYGLGVATGALLDSYHLKLASELGALFVFIIGTIIVIRTGRRLWRGY
jgi:hypothetical protein